MSDGERNGTQEETEWQVTMVKPRQDMTVGELDLPDGIEV